ncbi:MAG TPA: hypothetical protein VGE26_02695 [Sphingobacteriaceae bacterium]
MSNKREVTIAQAILDEAKSYLPNVNEHQTDFFRVQIDKYAIYFKRVETDTGDEWVHTKGYEVG